MRERLGGTHSADLIIRSYGFAAMLLVDVDHVAVPWFPTTRLHARAVVDAALAP